MKDLELRALQQAVLLQPPESHMAQHDPSPVINLCFTNSYGHYDLRRGGLVCPSKLTACRRFNLRAVAAVCRRLWRKSQAHSPRDQLLRHIHQLGGRPSFQQRAHQVRTTCAREEKILHQLDPSVGPPTASEMCFTELASPFDFLHPD